MSRIFLASLVLFISSVFIVDPSWSAQTINKDIDVSTHSLYKNPAHTTMLETDSLVKTSLQECVEDVSEANLGYLLYTLKNNADTKDSKNLRIIGSNAFEKAREENNTRALFKAAIRCQKAGLEDLANQSGLLAVQLVNNPFSLINMAKKFLAVQLLDLKSQAAKKAVDLSKHDAEVESRYIAYTLVQLTENNLAEKVLINILRKSSHWSEIFEVYQRLKQIKMEKTAEVSFVKLMEILRKQENGAGWLMYVSRECWEKFYIKDSKRAANLSLEQQRYVPELLEILKQVKKFGFEDLTAKGKRKLVETFTLHPSLYKLMRYCTSLFDIGEGNCALQLCEIAFKNGSSTVHQFPELFDIIMLLHNKEEDEMVEKGLQQAIRVCNPRDMMVTCTGQTLWFYSSPSCLLMISALSQMCENHPLSQQIANDAIAYTLAEPYNTLEEFLWALKDLEINLQRLQFPNLVKKVEYYRSETDSPSLDQTPSLYPHIFDVYWVNLTGTKGSEIKKQRPCIITSRTSHYGKGDMLTVVPLSTKRRPSVSSISICFESMDQEARLDQIRSIDTSRLGNYLGSLPIHYKTQLMLALKNYQCLLLTN